MRKLQLLARYKELTAQQRELLEQGDIDGALELTEEKDQVFSSLQEASKCENERTIDRADDFSLHLNEALRLNNEVVSLIRQRQEELVREIRKIQQGRQMQDLYKETTMEDAYFFDRKK